MTRNQNTTSDLSFLNDLLSSSNSNSTATSTTISQLQADIDRELGLATENGESITNMDESSIQSLIERIDQADLASDGLESRLDSLLRQLDGMLASLEGRNGSTAITTTPGIVKSDVVDSEKVAEADDKKSSGNHNENA